MRKLVAAFMTLATLMPAFSGVASGQDVPTIYLYVNDFVGVLTYEEVATLDDICYELDMYNSDEIAIVIVNTTQPLGIDVYAFESFYANGIGKEDKNNGVLILVSVSEELWRIEVGYGLEGVLNDAKVGSIGRDNLEPYLAVGDYYPGIYYTLTGLIEAIVADPSQQDGGGNSLFGIHIDWRHVAIALVVFLILAVITKGRILIWIGNIFTRGGFGGGRSGGGGAKGRF